MEEEKFHRAARDGYLDILRSGTRKEMNSPDEDGNTPTLLAAQNGNLDALRMIIMRGGDPNKMDLLGFTALHHSARNGHMNCVSFLISYGVNIWALDNDMHSALDIAGLENREDIVKVLDDAQSVQKAKNPKMVQSFKEKAVVAADKNAKHYEKLQEKANKELTKTRRRMEKMDQLQAHQNGDFNPPTEKSFFKKLTLRIKGNTFKTKTANGSTPQFSDIVQGTKRGGTSRKLASKFYSDTTSTADFKTSEMDESGRRTLKSLKVSGVQKDGQVLYMTERDNMDTTGARPALANVFPGTSLIGDNRNLSKSDPNLLDSGIDSYDSNQYDDEDSETKPGIFSRPMFGQISFLGRMDLNEIKSGANNSASDAGDTDISVLNGHESDNGENKRHSGGTDSIGTIGSLTERMQELPWKDEYVDNLDDDEEETEFTPVVLFLETCGLTRFTYLFTKGEVDMDALMRLTNADFQEMGLQVGPRRKLMDAIERRRNVLETPSSMKDTLL